MTAIFRIYFKHALFHSPVTEALSTRDLGTRLGSKGMNHKMNHKQIFGKPVNGSNAGLTPSSPASFPVVLDDFVCDVNVTSNLSGKPSGKWFQAYSAC